MSNKLSNLNEKDIKQVKHPKFGHSYQIGEQSETHSEFDGLVLLLQIDPAVSDKYKMTLTQFENQEVVSSSYIKQIDELEFDEIDLQHYIDSDDDQDLDDNISENIENNLQFDYADERGFHHIANDEFEGNGRGKKENLLRDMILKYPYLKKQEDISEDEMSMDKVINIFRLVTLPISYLRQCFLGKVHYSEPQSLCQQDQIQSQNKKNNHQSCEQDSKMLKNIYQIQQDFEIIDWNKAVEYSNDEIQFYIQIEILDKEGVYTGKQKIGEELVFDMEQKFKERNYQSFCRFNNTIKLYKFDEELQNSLPQEYNGQMGITFRYGQEAI